MSKLIEIIVAPDGTTKVETSGFSGSECRNASRFIEKALGSSVNEQLKSEFYQATEQRTENQSRNG
jgi:hypothetical protein